MANYELGPVVFTVSKKHQRLELDIPLQEQFDGRREKLFAGIRRRFRPSEQGPQQKDPNDRMSPEE